MNKKDITKDDVFSVWDDRCLIYDIEGNWYKFIRLDNNSFHKGDIGWLFKKNGEMRVKYNAKRFTDLSIDYIREFGKRVQELYIESEVVRSKVNDSIRGSE